MRLSNFRIGTRLGAGFGFVLVLLAAAGAIGIYSMATIQQRLEQVVNRSSVQIAAATAISAGIRDIMFDLSILVQSEDKAARDAQKVKIGKARERYGNAKKTIAASGPDTSEKAFLDRLDASLKPAVPVNNEILAHLERGERQEATAKFLTQSQPYGRALIAITDEMLAYEQAVADATAARSRQEYERARALVLAACIGGVLLGAWAAWLIARSITRPIGQAVGVTETVAAGDLTLRIDSNARDETGRLLHALKTMSESLAALCGNVRSGAYAMSDAVGQIAAGNQDLSQRTEEQASALEQTAASMEQLTGTVRQNADNARQANGLAQSASTVAEKGGAVVGEVVQTMSSINESSNKIADIISVIDGIAFQTNILALNAAVEAARAGEQGRGFAVVASEVRNLAQRSAAAAKEIKTLIGDSVAKVDAGTALVAKAGQTMQEIVTSIRRVTDIMGEITGASEEQTRGITQVSQAITQMDQVTQQNAALVEEAASAAHSLREQAGGLVQAVSVFKLDTSVQEQQVVQRARVAAPAAVRTAPPKSAQAVARKRPAPAAKQPVEELATADTGDWKEF
jgi:methyl-accepting chemotaxis protein